MAAGCARVSGSSYICFLVRAFRDDLKFTIVQHTLLDSGQVINMVHPCASVGDGATISGGSCRTGAGLQVNVHPDIRLVGKHHTLGAAIGPMLEVPDRGREYVTSDIARQSMAANSANRDTKTMEATELAAGCCIVSAWDS